MGVALLEIFVLICFRLCWKFAGLLYKPHVKVIRAAAAVCHPRALESPDGKQIAVPLTDISALAKAQSSESQANEIGMAEAMV
jgi:hypothetical protein